MNIEKKITSAFIALLFLVGVSANTNAVMKSAMHTSSRLVTDSTNVDEHLHDSTSVDEASVVDEVIWVVGDEPILKSEVEATRLQSEAEGIKYEGDPDCSIPEQIALQKLFLHQAATKQTQMRQK